MRMELKSSFYTFGLVMSDDTYEMHDQVSAPLGPPPFQVAAWDPWSVVSDVFGNEGQYVRTNDTYRFTLNILEE